MSPILSLVGRHIQLTKAPPQEQLETISSSRLMYSTFLLSFKGVTVQSARSETEKKSKFAVAIHGADVVLVVHDEMFQLKPRKDILLCGTRSGLFFKARKSFTARP